MAEEEEERDPSLSIVEYLRDHQGYRCGYCKENDTNFSHGMWCHQMSVGSYQDLIDRGWRRSGKYCYKPTMDKTCCPMYTIKCDALNVKLSKSQKKVLKRMHRFLSFGNVKDERKKDNDPPKNDGGSNESFVQPRNDFIRDVSSVCLPPNAADMTSDFGRSPAQSAEMAKSGPQAEKWPSDAGRPRPRKAKELRRERRAAKLAQRAELASRRGEDPMEETVAKGMADSAREKSLEDFLAAPLPQNPAHTLEVRLVRSQPSSGDFLRTFKASHRVYEKYQMSVHGDAKESCSEAQFRRFLCNSPLEPWRPRRGPSFGLGSFHHQYWLDGRLVAVGVVDVLPGCVSSVYLYYDPEYAFLSLGTYASLRELALTRELSLGSTPLRWYYMGFYIHSCPKMRYKGRYDPSFLLCPESYVWVPIASCLPKLDATKYSRLCDDQDDEDDQKGLAYLDISKVPILHEQEVVRYCTYRVLRPDALDEEEVREYVSLVGPKGASAMFLFRG